MASKEELEPAKVEGDEQRDLLESAAREGYFKVPREITLVELADRSGISDQEASEQIRRRLDALVHESVLDE